MKVFFTNNTLKILLIIDIVDKNPIRLSSTQSVE